MPTAVMSKKTVKNTRRKPTQSRAVVVAEVLLILLFAVVALVVVIGTLYSPPTVDDDPPFTDPKNEDPEITLPGETTSPDNPPQIQYVRKTGVYNFLIAGHDRVAVNTDVMMIASFDTKNNSLNLVQIPRDTYASYDWKNYHKINGLYSCSLEEAKYVRKDGMESVMAYLQQNLAIKLDYYVLIDLDILQELVDLIGGVYLNVPEDMEYLDPYQNLTIMLKAGPQTLNGEQAEQFVRFRAGYVQADIGRNDAQKIFMAAFLQQYKKNLNISTLTGTIDQIIKHVTTNLTAADCIFFAKEALNLDLSKVVMVNLPGEGILVTEGEYTSYFVLSRSGTLDAVNRFLNVYTEDITDALFDRNLVFSNSAKKQIHDIYLTDTKISNEYIADDVNQEGIHIPRT